MSQPEPDLVVLRAAPDLPPGWMPRGMDGRWEDRELILTRGLGRIPAGHAVAVAEPSGRFEVRDYDGAVAEVWEVRPVRQNEDPDLIAEG